MKNGRVNILKTINCPLGFFALALLIVEAFLTLVLVLSDLEKSQKYMGMWLGVILFVIVIIIVALLVWFKPRHLMYDMEGHLRDTGKYPYGTNEEQISKEEMITSDKVESKE